MGSLFRFVAVYAFCRRFVTSQRTPFYSELFRQEPTKMDNDVLKALHNVDIDKNTFPIIFQWYNALMKYTLEERARFVLEHHSYINLNNSMR